MIHYKVYKLREDADWILCLHGLGGSSTIWYKQIKSYKKKFNVVIIDLRGHGKSNKGFEKYKTYTYKEIVDDIVAVLDNLDIDRFHIAGISLGSIVAKAMSVFCPQRIKSMVLGGAVLKMDLKSRIGMFLGYLLNGFLPYMFLYTLFAMILMPRKRHKYSRLVFQREARKLGKKEFTKWYKLLMKLSELNINLVYYKKIPKLYVMGEEDYVFIGFAKKDIQIRDNKAKIHVIDKCGHVCNIEQSEEFNKVSVEFFEKHSLEISNG